jgi:CRP-like cAMP-binding protein
LNDGREYKHQARGAKKTVTTIKYFRNSEDAQTFRAGQIVFTEGDPGNMMYAILEGEVDIMVGDQVVGIIPAGSIVGEMALIDHSPRSATAVARTECRLVPIDERRFLFMVQQTPNFSLDVMRIMAARLRDMDALMDSRS